jgi:hypothetical protein
LKEHSNMTRKSQQNTGLQRPARRWWLQASVAAAALWLTACGGGGNGGSSADGDGDGSGGPPPDDNAAQPSGWLVYCNSSEAAAHDFATRSETVFDTGSRPFVDPGMSAAPGRVAMAAQEGDNDGFAFTTFDLAGNRRSTLRLDRPFAFQTSAVLVDGSGSRAALSVNEPTSAASNDRIDRVLVMDWPANAVLGVIDGYEEPVWDRSSGELLVRDAASGRLRLFGPALEDRGWLADIVVAPTIGAYDVSPDGRCVVYDDQTNLLGHDRETGERWVVADRISSLREPCFSPDGRFLAMHAIDLTSATSAFTTYVPHVVPFERRVTVTVDSALHRLSSESLAETSGRIGWVA